MFSNLHVDPHFHLASFSCVWKASFIKIHSAGLLVKNSHVHTPGESLFISFFSLIFEKYFYWVQSSNCRVFPLCFKDIASSVFWLAMFLTKSQLASLFSFLWVLLDFSVTSFKQCDYVMPNCSFLHVGVDHLWSVFLQIMFALWPESGHPPLPSPRGLRAGTLPSPRGLRALSPSPAQVVPSSASCMSSLVCSGRRSAREVRWSSAHVQSTLASLLQPVFAPWALMLPSWLLFLCPHLRKCCFGNSQQQAGAVIGLISLPSCTVPWKLLFFIFCLKIF